MDLVLEKADVFRKSIEAIAVLISEAEFVITEDALTLQATDPSQISMIDYRLDKKAFKKFDVKEKTKIGLDLDYLKQVVSRAKAGDELTLHLDKENSRLTVTLKGDSTRTFEIPLIDISSSELPNPKIEFDAELKLKASVLQDALKDASLISTHVSLGVDSEKFFVRADSSRGTLNSETMKNGKTLIELNVKNNASSMFPSDYLTDMLKTASPDSDVTLKLKSNAPVNLSYKIGDASITYFLAPRIEN